MIILLKSKIHRATVTEKNLDYLGSIFIDEDLMIKSNIVKFEKVEVINITNGKRWETYAYPEKKDSRIISIRGGAAHLCNIGDKLIILAYEITESNLANPKMILVDEENKFQKCL